MSGFGLEEFRFPFKLRFDPASLAKRYSTEFRGKTNYEDTINIDGYLRGDLQKAISILGHQHFGFHAEIDIAAMLKSCASIVEEFFCGTWYQRQRNQNTGELKFTDESYRTHVEFEWFLPYTEGVFLCMLGNSWAEANRISSWLHPELDMGYHGDLEPEVGKIIIALAESVSGKQVQIEPLASLTSKSRKKRPKLLFDLLKAVCERDQRAFDVALTANLKHFASRKPDQWELCDDWIAWYPSTLCLYGNHLGLKTPDLPRNLAIRLITRQSVGLE
jgi:hypothetical protein